MRKLFAILLLYIIPMVGLLFLGLRRRRGVVYFGLLVWIVGL